MMRVCIKKSTGVLIEMQSDAKEGTLIENALSAGYVHEEIEEKTVTEVEYLQILDMQPELARHKTETELLKEQISTMQGVLDFIIMNY